jgi:hypothetical protein
MRPSYLDKTPIWLKNGYTGPPADHLKAPQTPAEAGKGKYSPAKPTQRGATNRHFFQAHEYFRRMMVVTFCFRAVAAGWRH